MTELLPSIFAGCLSVGTLWLLLATGVARRLAVDLPNARSLHGHAVPRSGGVCFVPWLIGGWLLAGAEPLPVLLAGALALLSFFDDRYGMGAAHRLLVHLSVCGILVAFLGDVDSVVLGVALVLAVAWMTNLYNFMDGSDGLAGGMAIIGFATYALAAHEAGQPAFSSGNAAIAAAAAGFLVFNFPPARVFMGDAGSIPLGFLAGACGLVGWHNGCWPAWFPVAVFLPFILDATVTLLRRAARRERIWQAHREHYYQRLVRMGWSHRRVALAAYGAMIVVAMTALTLRRESAFAQMLGVALLFAGMGVLLFAVDRHWRRHQLLSGVVGT